MELEIKPNDSKFHAEHKKLERFFHITNRKGAMTSQRAPGITVPYMGHWNNMG